MSKKKKDKWIEEEDFVIPIFPSAFNSESTAELEFTFVVNNKFKELFKRAKEATRNDNFVVFFDNERTKLLTNLIYNINFDTMKIHKSSLDNNEIPKEIKKSARISLKGKKTGKENIYEKNITKVFEFDDCDDCDEFHIRSFFNLVDVVYAVKVEDIYEREEVYCRCSFKANKEYRTLGFFLGTFCDTSKNIDICLKQYNSNVLHAEPELVNSVMEGNRLILDLSVCKNFSDEPHEIKIEDISTIWRINARIGMNKSLYETINTLNEIEEVAEREGYISKRKRISLEISLLTAETNFTKTFISENILESNVFGYLRKYQEERLYNKLSNPVLKQLFEEEQSETGEVLFSYKIEHMISRFTKIYTVGFDINEQNETVEWVLDAEITGYELDILKKNFNSMLKNSNASQIEFTVKEECEQ